MYSTLYPVEFLVYEIHALEQYSIMADQQSPSITSPQSVQSFLYVVCYFLLKQLNYPFLQKNTCYINWIMNIKWVMVSCHNWIAPNANSL